MDLPPLRRDLATVARSLDWRMGWRAGDSRLEYRYSFFGCVEESFGEPRVGLRRCRGARIVEGVGSGPVDFDAV